MISIYKDPIRALNQADALLDFCRIVVVTTPKKKINVGSIRHHDKCIEVPQASMPRPPKMAPIKRAFRFCKGVKRMAMVW